MYICSTMISFLEMFSISISMIPIYMYDIHYFTSMYTYIIFYMLYVICYISFGKSLVIYCYI